MRGIRKAILGTTGRYAVPFSISLLFAACATASGDSSGTQDSGFAAPADASVGAADGSLPLGIDASVGPADANSGCNVGVPKELLTNGNFDTGPGTWEEVSGNEFELVIAANTITGLSADSGTFVSWLGGYAKVDGRDILSQDFSIPSDATPITITGRILVDSAEFPFLVWDTLDLVLVDASSGQVLENFSSWTNLDLGSSWTSFSVTASSAHAGADVQLRWVASVDDSNITSFFVDTLSAQTSTCE